MPISLPEETPVGEPDFRNFLGKNSLPGYINRPVLNVVPIKPISTYSPEFAPLAKWKIQIF